MESLPAGGKKHHSVRGEGFRRKDHPQLVDRRRERPIKRKLLSCKATLPRTQQKEPRESRKEIHTGGI